MDDSGLDFANLCSKLLKRVRKKERGNGATQNLTDNVDPVPTHSKYSTKRRKPKQHVESSSRKQLDCEPVSASQFDLPVRREGTGQQCARSEAVTQTPISLAAGVGSATAVPRLVARQDEDVHLSLKDKVVHRMQQFRRASPQKMTHGDNDLPKRTTVTAEDMITRSTVPQADDPLQGPLGDEALALRLQEELDREERGPQEMVDLEQGGLFFCQICQRDLSALSPLRRTQHINRCLDEGEGSGTAAAPPAAAPPTLPECPICGKRFKQQKSRASHMKRCSAEMGVAPAVLLQALQRQAAETSSDSAADQSLPAGGSKRKGSSNAPRPPKKRQKKKAPPLDEDTMVALALSRSMVEQERAREKEEREALITAAVADSVGPGLLWRADAGKRRGKKRGNPPSPPPLLLVQDPAEALRRLQDRVAALLLHARPPTPPTPPCPASRLPSWTGAAPLWQKSALRDEESGSKAEFYTPALCPPVQPWVVTEEMQPVLPPAQAEVLPPVRPPLPEPSSPHTPLPSTPGLSSQTLGDLMDLAEEGLTLTQCGYASKADPTPKLTPRPNEDRDVGAGDMRLSGFLPERPRSTAAAGNTGALSRLTADLSSMVNNPQLSDVQLQVDSGEVFFAHSFMLYARCPLLMQMVHDSGFGVEEEGMPSAQRVLLGDVTPEAIHVLLQYLYCARCPLTPFLVPHLQELALRLDLSDLEQVCQGFTGGAALEPWVESRDQGDEEEEEDECGDQKFLELLRSMWQEEEEAEDAGGGGNGEGEEVEGGGEGKVDEEELLEIYQFAATQRRCREEKEEEEEEDGEKRKVGTETEEEVEHREDGLYPVQTASHHHSKCLTAHIIPSEPEPLDWLSTGHITQEGPETKQASPITDHRSGTEGTGLDGTSQPSPGRGSNTSLERSYDRLFSETWGDMDSSQQDVQRSRSQAVLIDLSVSPPPEPSNSAFPIAGTSPEPATGQSCSPHTPAGWAQKQRTVGCSQINSTQREPELIVLSDSGEESYTLEHPSPPVHPPTPPPRSPSPPPSPPQALAGDIGRSGGSAEDSCEDMSWLVPGTPDPPARTTRISSTLTYCNMRRTRLFAALTSTSSASSSPPSLCTGAAAVSVRLTESSESGLSLPTPSTAPQSDSAHDPSIPAPASAPPPISSRQSGLHSSALAHSKHSILDGEPSTAFPYPASSTPLPPQPPLSAKVPPHEERQLESASICAGGSPTLRLSLSGSSPLSPQKHASSERRRFSACEDAEREEEGMEEGAEEAEAFLAQMDDPPMAFNESWGLDGGEGQGLCFSLRLDSSSGASQSAQGTGETMPRAPPPPLPGNHTQPHTRLLESEVWDNREAEGEDEDEEGDRASLPLSQRVQPMAVGQRVSQLKTPVASRSKGHAPLVPITPMPSYSDMDTPELKNKLNRFGVRPLPKRQMVLKLKEIHQYTHQLLSSESEEDGPAPNPILKPHPSSVSITFKQPERPTPVGAWSKDTAEKPVGPEQEGEGLSASQGSTASSTAASEDSERSNPELCFQSDSDGSDSEGVTASQAGARGAEKLQEVRSFILSDPELYGRVLRYQPLVLSQLQAQLKAHGIRLAATKLLDFLDSQCITFTTAKPAKPGPPKARGQGRGRGRGRRRGRPAKASD